MIVSKEGASTTVIEVANILRSYGSEYLQKFSKRMPPSHRRAFKDILRCRTPVMGCRVFECNRCSRHRYSYHSCCNRSCPKCHKSNNQAWLQGREKELLPVPYYHVIFYINAFERLAVIYRSQNKIKEEICISKKAIAFYENAVFNEHLESKLPILNQFTRRLKAAKSILSSQRDG